MPLPSGTCETPRRTISSGPSPVIGSPFSAMVPDAARAMPLIARGRVDFPAALAPRIATRPPVSTLIETSRRASTEPSRTQRPDTSSIVACAEIGEHHPGIAQHREGRTVGDELAEIDPFQPVAQPRDKGHVVL